MFMTLVGELPANPKIRSLMDRCMSGDPWGAMAVSLWTLCGTLAREALTDGVVSRTDTVRIMLNPEWADGCARLLVDVGLWHDAATEGECAQCAKHLRECATCGPLAHGEYRFHDWWQMRGYEHAVQSKVVVAKRKELQDKQLRAQVWARDAEPTDSTVAACRYCGHECRHADRKSERAWTLDHVDPAVADGARNLVVACRRCNQMKGNRTPEQAGLTLRPGPRSGSQQNVQDPKGGSSEPHLVGTERTGSPPREVAAGSSSMVSRSRQDAGRRPAGGVAGLQACTPPETGYAGLSASTPSPDRSGARPAGPSGGAGQPHPLTPATSDQPSTPPPGGRTRSPSLVSGSRQDAGRRPAGGVAGLQACTPPETGYAGLSASTPPSDRSAARPAGPSGGAGQPPPSSPASEPAAPPVAAGEQPRRPDWRDGVHVPWEGAPTPPGPGQVHQSPLPHGAPPTRGLPGSREKSKSDQVDPDLDPRLDQGSSSCPRARAGLVEVLVNGSGSGLGPGDGSGSGSGGGDGSPPGGRRRRRKRRGGSGGGRGPSGSGPAGSGDAGPASGVGFGSGGVAGDVAPTDFSVVPGLYGSPFRGHAGSWRDRDEMSTCSVHGVDLPCRVCASESEGE